ncbi:MAG: hypothetical protein MnENMB40S_38490 [Rhizobiaceae bacterium MnEN-MB40S]|nr:MAG: hypothetical protein MnENMB40S_38490 [Rhizobiaceae bacterium MnEN-MB40S]
MAEHYLVEPSIEHLAKLHAATEPRRRRLIIRLNQAPDATLQLIRMRSDLLKLSSSHLELKEVDRDFAKLFASWFNGGFLQLERLGWSSPAAILENIIKYEAVHGMADWRDLRARLDPPDRKIYGFFHPRLGHEPLIFIEVALMAAMPTNIQDVLSDERQRLRPSEATTAVFYSISNCQYGLRGVPLGSFLIKRVVEDLRTIFPHLSKFVTLSPVPGFSDWLRGWIDDVNECVSPETRLRVSDSLALLQDPASASDNTTKREVRDLLASAVGHYLTNVKSDDGLPWDPVARFHLGNGARLEQINWPADISPKGMAKSFGVMVNYLYDLDEVERYHENLAAHRKIAVSNRVLRDIGKTSFLAGPAPDTFSEAS